MVGVHSAFHIRHVTVAEGTAHRLQAPMPGQWTQRFVRTQAYFRAFRLVVDRAFLNLASGRHRTLFGIEDPPGSIVRSG